MATIRMMFVANATGMANTRIVRRSHHGRSMIMAATDIAENCTHSQSAAGIGDFQRQFIDDDMAALTQCRHTKQLQWTHVLHIAANR